MPFKVWEKIFDNYVLCAWPDTQRRAALPRWSLASQNAYLPQEHLNLSTPLLWCLLLLLIFTHIEQSDMLMSLLGIDYSWTLVLHKLILFCIVDFNAQQ